MSKIHGMRWMTPLCSAVLLAAAALSTAQAETPLDSAWVLGKIARPAPMRTQFVEIRSSDYLKTPMRIYGEYSRPDNSTLVRKVSAPYTEVTRLSGSNATVTRAGKSRTFSLNRVPELASMQSSFGALLRGDESAVRRDFNIQSKGTREQWNLVMTPKNATLANRIASINLYGRGAELRCIETQPKGNSHVQRTLLASAAASVKPQTAEASLLVMCHGK